MNICVSKLRKVTWYYYHYTWTLFNYVFHCSIMSMYTQHYGGLNNKFS